MCAMEKMTSCQLSFIPIGKKDYLSSIQKVLDLITATKLESHIGDMSTIVKGDRQEIFQLLEDIYEKMDGECHFTLDVKLSNVCGCDL